MRKERSFDEYKAEPIIRDIFEGLLYLSEKYVIHRDLKVANVFMHNGSAKIADFGFAKFTKYNLNNAGKNSKILILGHQFICLLKDLSTTYMDRRQMFGLSVC